jgi:hypothetical protein
MLKLVIALYLGSHLKLNGIVLWPVLKLLNSELLILKLS